LSDPGASEPGYRRPVVIVQSDKFNQSNINTVLCAAITSNLALANAPGNVRVSAKATGLSKPSVINISQLITVDKRFLSERVKLLDAGSMHKVEDGLRLILGL
jgi:mRNA interferase MazF